MTMKRQKTLHRFATVAAVLLAFCLVFMMPVGADGVDCSSSCSDTELHVAAIGTTHYTSLQDAVTAVQDTTSTEIDVLQSVEMTEGLTIPANKVITLDLNGYTVSREKETEISGTLYVIENKGTLTIQDSSEEGTGTITSAFANPDTELEPEGFPTYATNTITNKGDLYINSGLIECRTLGTASYAIDTYGATYSGGSTVTVTGGKIYGENAAAIRCNTAGNADNLVSIYVNGGKVESPVTGIWIQQTKSSNLCPYYLKITEGEVFGKNQALYYAILNNDESGTKMTEITGGIIKNNNDNSDKPDRNPPRAAIRYDLDTHKVGNEYQYYVTSMENHQLKITGGEVKNEAGGFTVVYNSDSTVAPTLIGVEISGFDSVSSSNNFVGTYTTPPIGKSYEWSVGDVALDGSSNEKEITFDPTKGTTQTVSVKIVLSDTTSTTITKDVSVPAKYTLTFNAGEGSGAMDSEIAYSDNNVIDLPPCTFTAPEGKVFKAWQIDGTEYAAGVSYTVNADTSVTAVWKEVGAAVAPSLVDDVADVNDDGTTEINTSADNVEPDEINNKVTITDQSTGVKIDVQYDDDVSFDDGTASGNVDKITVTYPENQVAASADADSTEEVITQTVSFQLDTLTTVLPKIESVFKEEEAQKITEKPEFKDHKPFAMITATNADSVNNNMTSADSFVTVEFRVPKTLVDKLVNGNLDLLRGYHITIEDGKEVVKEIEISTPVLDGDDYIIILTGNGFSSYVLGYEEPKTNIGNNGGGSATDTGSGNYQYYPRSVPTDGIVDFGTSKVVTGMELPAGSDGTVTLNIKPTFAMPENGFYAFEIDAPGYNLDAKINGGLSFQIPVADLEAAGWTAEDIVLFHGTVGEDGKITWEALPTNLVKNENGVAYYKAAINGCSPFYIGFVKDGSVVNTEVVDPVTPETPVTPDEPEVLPPVDEPETPEQPTESPAPILAVLAGLGAAVVLRRK